MEGSIVFKTSQERLASKKLMKKFYKKEEINLPNYQRLFKCTRYSKREIKHNQYTLNTRKKALKKVLTKDKELKSEKINKCYRKHNFGEYSRDFISEEEFMQLYVANGFTNCCSSCNTYFHRINEFVYAKDYPKEKIRLGRFEVYRDEKLVGTYEDELASKDIVKQLKKYKQYFKIKSLKKKERLHKRNPGLIEGYTMIEKTLINNIWSSLKKNNEFKPSHLREEELKAYIDKLPVTHYCHCCRKNNLYHKYRNHIKKKEEKFLP